MSGEPLRVIVLGGQGNFGARICRALSQDRQLKVLAAGRTDHAVGESGRAHAATAFVRVDMHAADFPAELARLRPSIVVHCAGPFQGQDYRVAAATIAAGAHYVDLADARNFVAGFGAAMNEAARAAGVVAIAGASTLPALSAAVVDTLRLRFMKLHEIRIAIAPGQRAPRGAATIAGVLSYAGRPFRQLAGGKWKKRHGWMALDRVRLGALGRRWSAVCDVPDLELLPARYPEVKTVEFRAALEVGLQHFFLWAVAILRRLRIPLPIERWAGLLDRVASGLDWLGSERGGMHVEVRGTLRDGRYGFAAWQLTAENNTGPEVPTMAAILLVRRIAAGELAERGAYPCVGLLRLEDFKPELARWDMRTQVEEHPY